MKDLVDYIETTDIEISRVDLIMLDMQVNDLAYLLSKHCFSDVHKIVVHQSRL